MLIQLVPTESNIIAGIHNEKVLSGADGEELHRMLEIVSQRGLGALSIPELDQLRTLLLAKNYGDNKKAEKFRRQLIRQINVEFYNKHSPRKFL